MCLKRSLSLKMAFVKKIKKMENTKKVETNLVIPNEIAKKSKTEIPVQSIPKLYSK